MLALPVCLAATCTSVHNRIWVSSYYSAAFLLPLQLLSAAAALEQKLCRCWRRSTESEALENANRAGSLLLSTCLVHTVQLVVTCERQSATPHAYQRDVLSYRLLGTGDKVPLVINRGALTHAGFGRPPLTGEVRVNVKSACNKCPVVRCIRIA